MSSKNDPTKSPPPRLEFDDGKRILQQSAPTNVSPSSDTNANPRQNIALSEYYEIPHLTSLIRERYRRYITSCPSPESKRSLYKIALQFPNESINDAASVSLLLEDSLLDAPDEPEEESGMNPLVFVLGDNTMGGDCCVDTLSAAHLTADVIIHFGNACLYGDEYGGAEVIFRFGQWDLDVGDVVASVRGVDKLLVLYDMKYEWKREELERCLAESLEGRGEVVVGTVPARCRAGGAEGKGRKRRVGGKGCGDGTSTCCGGTGVTTERTDEETAPMPTPSAGEEVIIGGLSVSLTSPLSTYTLLYIGTPSSPLTTKHHQLATILLQCYSSSSCITSCLIYTPSKGISPLPSLPPPLPKFLSRRYYTVQKTKMAQIIGLVVLSHHVPPSHITHLRSLVTNSGRGCYTFIVGKLNLPKLANFGEIGAFVLLGCHEFVTGLLLEGHDREFHVPVVTPFELVVALGLRDWDGFWSASTSVGDWCGGGPEEEDDAPYYSIVSGQYETKITPLVTTQEGVGQGQIVEYKSEGAEFLKQREYRGLGTVQTDEVKVVSKAIEGQVGIASDYGNR